MAIRITNLSGCGILFANKSYSQLINSEQYSNISTNPSVYYKRPDEYASILSTVKDGGMINNRLVELDIPNFGSKWSLASYLQIHYCGEEAIMGWFYDITDRVRSEEQQRLWARAFGSAKEGIMVSDAEGKIIDVNESFVTITGYSRDEVLGENPRFLQSGMQNDHFYTVMWESINSEGHWSGEIWNRKKNGDHYVEWLTISQIRDDRGNVSHYVGIFSDITELKQHNTRMEYIAHHDALTELPNRVLLADRMVQAIAQSKRDGKMLAVCYLDLDGFKPINDTHGHGVGDQVLVEISKRIVDATRENDTVARLGGDEFVTLLLGLEKLEECVLTVERILSRIAHPVVIDGKSVTLSASIGISIFPHDGDDLDILLRQADQSMYIAKQTGKNRYHLYDTAYDERSRFHQATVNAIRHGLAAHEFELFYQPKMDLISGTVVGAEALIRWHHPERGLLAPAEFLPYIENTNLGIEIGKWVMNTAIAQLSSWNNDGLDLEVSINIAADHLESNDFIEDLRTAINRYPDLPKGRLQIEVLETVALSDVENVNRTIEACQELGVSFALDDFGTGYSSLTYLRQLPTVTLKIDQSFVRDMQEDVGDRAIVSGIIALAKAFETVTIAEGIESLMHCQALVNMGCVFGQGYAFSRPMTEGDFELWVKNHSPDDFLSEMALKCQHSTD